MGETEQNSYYESKEKFQQQLQDIFQTTLRLTRPDRFDQLCQWMEYKQYLTINDFYDSSYNDPEKFDNKGPATEYKWKGKMNHLSANVAQKLKRYVRWMTHEDRPYELHDDFLATLTRDNYLKFRHMDSQSFSASSPSHHEPYKLKTSFSGESKHQTPSKSTPAPQQVHQHSQDEPTEEPTPDTVENSSSRFYLISCSLGILNSSRLLLLSSPKIACLHVSFTAYENFYILSKMHCHLVLTFLFLILRMSECRNPTIKHISTYTLVSSSITTYVTDLFLGSNLQSKIPF